MFNNVDQKRKPMLTIYAKVWLLSHGKMVFEMAKNVWMVSCKLLIMVQNYYNYIFLLDKIILILVVHKLYSEL